MSHPGSGGADPRLGGHPGPDGIFAPNFASGLGNLADPGRFGQSEEFGDEFDC